jgi:hypothetical protein
MKSRVVAIASAAEVRRNRNVGTAHPTKSPTVRKSQSLQDQHFEERRRIAERVLRDLREAGYFCGLVDDGYARALKREH